jgi:hypothetical protein
MPAEVAKTTKLIQGLAAAIAAAVALRVVPAAICARNAQGILDGRSDAAIRAVRGAGKNIAAPLPLERFGTGSTRFDGEWRFMSYAGAAYAGAQVAVEYPRHLDDSTLVLTTAVHKALEPAGYSHDTDAWKEDALTSLASEVNGHAAVLGYLCTALALEHRVLPVAEHFALETSIRHALARRVKASPTGLVESYPHETYPPDNASIFACLMLGDDESKAVGGALEDSLLVRHTSKTTGLLYQHVDATTGAPLDNGRASGTAYAAYFLSIGGSTLAGEYLRVLSRQSTSVLGFGGIREYVGNAGMGDGIGDVDSGPLLFGMTTSGSAFALGAAKAYGDGALFKRLYASAHMFGMPVDNSSRRNSVVGGPVTDSIIAAMISARAPGAWQKTPLKSAADSKAPTTGAP